MTRNTHHTHTQIGQTSKNLTANIHRQKRKPRKSLYQKTDNSGRLIYRMPARLCAKTQLNMARMAVNARPANS